MDPMIVLFTDFGWQDPYVGQVHAVLARQAPGVPVIDLMHNVPAYDVRAGAYLLAAYAEFFPAGTVFLCVVDPGVGGPRRPLVLAAGGRRYVGPDNGLLRLAARRAGGGEAAEILWRPGRLAPTFHGRDLFAPVAARLARGESVPRRAVAGIDPPDPRWPDDLPEVIYVDHYGNAVTGLRGAAVDTGALLRVAGQRLRRAEYFAERPPGEPFWYVNANGLVEIAANRASAARRLGIGPGTAVAVEAGGAG